MLSPFPRNNPLPVPPTETETHPPNDEGGSQLEIFIIMSATAPDLVLCDIQTPEMWVWARIRTNGPRSEVGRRSFVKVFIIHNSSLLPG